MRFIAFDCETGGIPRGRSLLTAYFKIFNENFDVLAELDLKIKPDGKDPYIVDAEAMGVNGIDLVQHDKVATPISQAKQQLYKFLRDNSNNGEFKLIPVGQNIYFDIQFILDCMLSKKTWDQFVSYHIVDTGNIANFFKLAGFIPRSQKTRLSALGELFGIDVKDLHTAKGDTDLCIEVLKKQIKFVKEGIIDE